MSQISSLEQKMLNSNETLSFSVEENETGLVLMICGNASSRSSGKLFDVLCQLTNRECKQIVVELSQLQTISRPASRAIVVAAKLQQMSGGQMKITGAKGSVRELLLGLGLNHLIKMQCAASAGEYKLQKSSGNFPCNHVLFSSRDMLSQPSPNTVELRAGQGNFGTEWSRIDGS